MTIINWVVKKITIYSKSERIAFFVCLFVLFFINLYLNILERNETKNEGGKNEVSTAAESRSVAP